MSDFVWPANPTTGDQTTGPYQEVYEFDGVKWSLVVGGAGPGGSNQVSIVFFFPGQPASSAPIVVPIAFEIAILPNLAGSVTYMETRPAATTGIFILQHVTAISSTTIGDITFATDGTPTFSGAGGTVQAGDTLIMFAPNTPDAAMANVAITVLATRA